MIYKVFEGEEMECCLCGKKEREIPQVEKHKGCAMIGPGANVYACPACTPGGKGSKENWRCFWMRMFTEAEKGSGRREESPAGR